MRYLKYILVLLILVPALPIQAQEATARTPFSSEQRELFIQKASQFRKEENYTAAIQQLDSLLNNQQKDAGILLFKGDLQLQNKNYSGAIFTYHQLLPLNYESTITQINLSYALFMNHQPANALQYAKKAWKENKTNSNAIVNYFNALLWNSKTNEASIFLKQQETRLTSSQVLVLKARLFTTSGDYTKGLHYYDSLVTNYSDKYYVAEYADVLLGKKDIKQSSAVLKRHQQLFSANEYSAFQQKIKGAQLQNAGTEFVYFTDIAKNIRIENSVWWQQQDGRTYRFRLAAGASGITSAQNEKTNAQFARVAIDEYWNKTWRGETAVHLQLIQPSVGSRFTGVTGKQTIQYQPNDRRMVGAFISSDILNFTASLLEKNIRSTSAGYITHLMLSGKTGFFSQGSLGALTDKNQQSQVFGSFYHLFRTEPTLKGGINFSALHYKDSSIKTYFSPNRYLSTELFADYSTALPHLSKLYLQVQAAAGLQKIEQQKWEPAFRLQTELGLRLKHIETSLKYQTSNVASATGTGYKFNWFTMRLMWKW
jgi:tetratricopeptide (TPR) repeat protein